MNPFEAKLKSAGVDTIGARFTVLCTEAIRLHPHSTVDAWKHVGSQFGYEYLRALMKDMQGNAPQKEERSPETPLSKDISIVGTSNARREPFLSKNPLRKPQVRKTEHQKELTRQAALMTSPTLQRLGMAGSRCRELYGFVHENANRGGADIESAFEHIMRATFAQLLLNHAVPADENMLIQEAYSEDIMRRQAARAMTQTPRILARLSAKQIEQKVKLIAAE